MIEIIGKYILNAGAVWGFVLGSKHIWGLILALRKDAVELTEASMTEFNDNSCRGCNQDCTELVARIEMKISSVSSSLESSMQAIIQHLSQLDDKISMNEGLLEDVVSPLESLVATMKQSTHGHGEKVTSKSRNRGRYATWINEGGV